MYNIQKKSGSRGFTLVELMIVVAIIGVLAALAIYGVTRYLSSAKTSEAKNNIGAISRSAVAAYNREVLPGELLAGGSASTTSSKTVCSSAAAVPATLQPGKKYMPVTDGTADFGLGSDTAGWRCLRFQVTEPILYQYQYDATVNDPVEGSTWTSLAVGDIDGDTVASSFKRAGVIRDGEAVLSTTLEIVEEFE